MKWTLSLLSLTMVAALVCTTLAQPEGRRRPDGPPRDGDRAGPPRDGDRRGPPRDGDRRGPPRDGDRAGPPRGFPPMPILQALDADQNGEISAKEIENAAEALKSLDKNEDGKLTPEELRPQFDGRRGPGGFGRPPRDGDRPDFRGPRDGEGPPRRGPRDGDAGPPRDGERPDRPRRPRPEAE